MLLGAACAAIQRFEVRDTERMLVAAGFHMRLADTPEPQEDLRSMPPYRIVSRTKDHNVVYMYADPDNCHCVYVGGSKEYSEYERRMVETEITQRRQEKQEGRREHPAPLLAGTAGVSRARFKYIIEQLRPRLRSRQAANVTVLTATG